MQHLFFLKYVLICKDSKMISIECKATKSPLPYDATKSSKISFKIQFIILYKAQNNQHFKKTNFLNQIRKHFLIINK